MRIRQYVCEKENFRLFSLKVYKKCVFLVKTNKKQYDFFYSTHT